VKIFNLIKSFVRIFFSKPIVLFTGFLFFIVSAYTQSASSTIDRNKILLGEQVNLQLKAEDINTRMFFLQDWFNIPDSVSHIQVIKRSAIDTINVGGVTTFTQMLTITSFDSGKWKLGPLQLIMQDRTTGNQTVLQTDSVVLEVLPVDVSNMQNYHDVKDILDVEVKPNYWLYVAIAASAIVLIILIWLMVKGSKKKKVDLPKPAYKGTPLEHALQQIKELEGEDLPAKQQVKLFYTRLSDILRNYFNDRFNVHSSHATSDELMVLLSVYLQDEKYRIEFYQLLRLSDAVKFAKYIPSTEQNEKAVKTAIETLQHVDKLTERTKQNAERMAATY
jgi:hypothetical protein